MALALNMTLALTLAPSMVVQIRDSPQHPDTQHSCQVNVTKYSPNRLYITSASRWGKVRVWDTVNKELQLLQQAINTAPITTTTNTAPATTNTNAAPTTTTAAPTTTTTTVVPTTATTDAPTTTTMLLPAISDHKRKRQVGRSYNMLATEPTLTPLPASLLAGEPGESGIPSTRSYNCCPNNDNHNCCTNNCNH